MNQREKNLQLEYEEIDRQTVKRKARRATKAAAAGLAAAGAAVAAVAATDAEAIAIRTTAAAAAVAKDRKRLVALRDEFPDDLEFAVEQFRKDASATDVQAAFDVLLKERQAAAKLNPPQQQVSIGASPIPFGESIQGALGDNDLCQQIKSLASDEGISFKEARLRLRDLDPASTK